VGRSTSVRELTALIGETWATELASWTTMRHGLVHRAEQPYVRRADAGRCIELVCKVESVVDEIIAGPPIEVDWP